MSQWQYVRFFDQLGIDDVGLVGGKTASLGEMYRNLAGDGVRIPNGFAITAQAYRYMLEAAGALPGLHAALDDLDPADVNDLARRPDRAPLGWTRLARRAIRGRKPPSSIYF